MSRCYFDFSRVDDDLSRAMSDAHMIEDESGLRDAIGRGDDVWAWYDPAASVLGGIQDLRWSTDESIAYRQYRDSSQSI